MRTAALLFTCALGVVASRHETFSPARYRSGTVPTLPAMVVGGGQVMLEVTVNPAGQVATIAPLRTTPPFTDLTAAAVRDWQFVPAEDIAVHAQRGQRPSRSAVESKVLVVAVFRPPALNAPTLGEPPRDVAAASDEIAFPLTISMPPFPPSAAGGGVVLLEARVDSSGSVSDTTVIHSAPPFDPAARAALAQWRFRSARVHGAPAPMFVYVLFGFPLPVSHSPGGRRDGKN
ncbi:MAG TPA: energy transducer TonB [Vicinamibacterales bacterium]